jgi:elongation factor Ts
MTEVTASMVKELREKTGAGMMDCKSALTETGGDFEIAIDWLRKKGLSKAAKKADRIAAEGLIGVVSDGGSGAIVEVNSETDFVAKNEQFKDFVRRAAALSLETGGDLASLLKEDYGGGRNIQETLTQLVATIGENLTVRRAAALKVGPGVVASYVHNAAAPGLGKIGVLVALNSTADKTRLGELGRQLAMHIAWAKPLALKPEQLPKDLVERERAVHAAAAAASGKAKNVIEKMTEGRMRKYFEETVLLHQMFLHDQNTAVAKIVEEFGAKLGAPTSIQAFVRFEVGEGIDKGPADFADEVKKLAG